MSKPVAQGRIFPFSKQHPIRVAWLLGLIAIIAGHALIPSSFALAHTSGSAFSAYTADVSLRPKRKDGAESGDIKPAVTGLSCDGPDNGHKLFLLAACPDIHASQGWKTTLHPWPAPLAILRYEPVAAFRARAPPHN